MSRSLISCLPTRVQGGLSLRPTARRSIVGGHSRTKSSGELGISTDRFELSFSNLSGLGLVEVGGRAFGSTLMTVLNKREIGLTALGEAFVGACSHGAPAKSATSVG